MNAAGGKVCVICGQDCSGRARIKDAKGHYACRACVDARRAKRGPQAHPRPAAGAAATASTGSDAAQASASDEGLFALADDVPVLDDLPATPSPTGRPCPGCGMPTKAGAIICLGCGLNIETGAEAATRVRERRVREPIGKPSPGRLAVGLALSSAGAAVGLGVWAGLATSTGRPWYAMAGLVGLLAGVGVLIAVRGAGRVVTGAIALGPGLVATGVGLVLFAPEPTEPFANPFGHPLAGFASADTSMVDVMGDDEAVLAGAAWLAIAGVSAFAFGRSNPDDEDVGDESTGVEGDA